MIGVNVVITIILVMLLLVVGYYHLMFLIDRDICARGKLTVPKDTYRFYDCSKHKIIQCKNGIFLRGDQHECVNDVCTKSITIYETIGNHTIPVKIVICLPNTNDPIEKSCEILTETIPSDDISLLANSNYVVPVMPRFLEEIIPVTQIDTLSGECIEFVPNDIVRMVTHNQTLPVVPLNIRTKQIEYSPGLVGSDEFFFTDYTQIKQYPSNDTVEGNYANFTASASIQELEYQDTVNVIKGDADGVTYLISFEMPPFRGRNRLNFCTTDLPDQSDLQCPYGRFWSTYSLNYEMPFFAQSDQAKVFLELMEFSEKSYTFVYKIEFNRNIGGYLLHVLTLYGFCSFDIFLNDGVKIDANGHIVSNLFPSYDEMISGLNCLCDDTADCKSKSVQCYNTTAIVTNIYDNKFNYKHVPIFWPYIKIGNLRFPWILLQDYDLEVEDLFDVPHEYIYKLPPSPSLSSNGNI
jgi:hypothetical protein